MKDQCHQMETRMTCCVCTAQNKFDAKWFYFVQMRDMVLNGKLINCRKSINLLMFGAIKRAFELQRQCVVICGSRIILNQIEKEHKPKQKKKPGKSSYVSSGFHSKC